LIFATVFSIAGSPLILFLEFPVDIRAQALFGVPAVLCAGVYIIEDGLSAGRAIHLHIDGKQFHLAAAPRALLELDGGCAAAERTGTFKKHIHPPSLKVKRCANHDLSHTMPAPGWY
jgi:hypothetical protein